MVGKISARAGLKPRTARSVDQHLIHRATGTPGMIENLYDAVLIGYHIMHVYI